MPGRAIPKEVKDRDHLHTALCGSKGKEIF